MIDTANLPGWTVLLVEDEPLIGMDVALALEAVGAIVHGPFRNNKDGLAAVNGLTSGCKFDVAVLDAHLGEDTCEPLVLRLKELGIPFVLHTGDWQGASDFIERRSVSVVRKPALTVTLIAALRKCVRLQR